MSMGLPGTSAGKRPVSGCYEDSDTGRSSINNMNHMVRLQQITLKVIIKNRYNLEIRKATLKDEG